MKKATQNELIIEHLATEGSISFLEAWTLYKVRSLPRRIADLRDAGFNVETEMRKDHTGQRYARYYMP